MTRWVMAADLERCVGCQTCTAACRHANATSPAVQWRKVLDVESGIYPDVRRTFVPVGCQHCEEPPCMHVCPSTATRRRADGIVTIDYDLCIGCAYCFVACPYQARFKVDAAHFAFGTTAMCNEIAREEPRRLGVAQKCTFCVDRIDYGIANGIAPGVDPRATPACVNACIASALHFGDLDDPGSNVAQLLREHRHFRMHEELGTGPGFYYLHGKANGSADRFIPPRDGEGGRAKRGRVGSPHPAQRLGASPPSPPGRESAAGNVRTRGVEPWLQTNWDWRAAANFMCGGAGAGLFACATLATFAEIPSLPIAILALALVAAGLLCVWLEIGRPWRFINVLRQPQRSWMTREAWVAMVFFGLGLAAVWFASRWLMAAAALAGLGFLYCQARMLGAAKGIPVWRAPLMAPLMVTTGLCEGAGLFLAATALLWSIGPARTAAAASLTVMVAVRGVVWRAYLDSLEINGAPIRALELLGAFHSWFLLFGAVLPIALIAAAFMAPSAGVPLLAAAGCSAFGAGWALKFILVTRAAYNQGFAVAGLPVHGSSMAGPSVKPGWRMQ